MSYRKEFMNKTLQIVLLFFIGKTALCQNYQDTIIIEDKIIVAKNNTSNKYEISDLKTKLFNVKYFQIIEDNFGFQIIDSNNKNLFFKTLNGFIEEAKGYFEVAGYEEVCGTVPNYKRKIKKSKNSYKVLQKEFYPGLEENKKYSLLKSIPFEKANKITFINGLDSIHFDFNETVQTNGIILYESPEIIIYKFKNKYGILDLTKPIYDSIYLKDGITIVRTNKLLNVFRINGVPKYKNIFETKGYLTRIEFINGKKGYLDFQGKEIED